MPLSEQFKTVQAALQRALLVGPGVLLLSCLCWPLTAAAASVYLEQLTSPEVRERVAAGATTILIPIGGTEQNGPYLVLGKHNRRAHLLAGQIAQKLGNALVAPVMAYVPEGSITPPAAHMRFAGTISIPDSAFEAILDATARSFKQHGFRDVVFLGDHGGYQKSLQRVAQKLNREWSTGRACQVHALPEYYRAAAADYAGILKQRGYRDAEIGTHAGLADTALSMALEPALVRSEALAHAAKPGEREGVAGDPRRASAGLGQAGVEHIVDSATHAIRQATGAK